MKPGVCLRLFNAGGGTLSPDYDSLEVPEDQVFEVSNTEDTKEWTFTRDGILLVAIMADYPYRTVDFELSHFGQELKYTFGEQSIPYLIGHRIRKRLVSIPYYSNEPVTVRLRSGTSRDWIGVKVRHIPFGL